MVQAVQERGRRNAIWFIDAKDSLLADLCDYVVTYPAPGTEQIKFFMVADRLMQKTKNLQITKIITKNWKNICLQV